MDQNPYLSMFLDESMEHLQTINDQLLALEQQPDDIGIVQTIFRSAHTLKGMSATMGFENLASLTHKMENVLDLVRNGKLKIHSGILDVLFQSLDALEGMVRDIADGGTGKADVSQITAALQAIERGDAAPVPSAGAGGSGGKEVAAGDGLDEYQYSVLLQTIQSGLHAYVVHVKIREDCVLKSVRAYMVFHELEPRGEIIKSTPPAEEIEQDKFGRSFSLYYASALSREEVEAIVNGISELESVQVEQLDEDALAARKQGARAAAAASAEPAGKADAAAAKETAAAAARTAAPEGAPAKAASAGGGAVTRSIRVDLDRLDTLMNLFSELLIDRVRLESLAAEIGRQDLEETVEHMARVSSNLQSIVMKLRMVPIESVFNRFPRMVRDLARSLNKKVDLIITGAETELDRTVIDEIGDPLVHLLRNALDHGIEPVAERVAAGKPETGTIWLRAFHNGNHVFIEIEDDGKGIRRDVVLRKAIERGIVTPEQAETMPDGDVYQLLFASGFSTAEKVSDISGRGVGLDVVKTKIQALSGHIHIESKEGSGTLFSVQLPLTLSIIAAMLIRLGGEKYAIPLSSIVETAIVKKDGVRNVHGETLMNYRSGIIPLVNLAQVLECPDSTAFGEEEMNVVIIRKGDRMAALVVDELLGQQEIVLKSLGKYLTGSFAVSGATILGDGQVALIIDTNALVK
jgi:two-component system chemotaxis sensor kinase CheA